MFRDQGVTGVKNPVQNKKGLPFGVKGAFANNLKDMDVTFFAGQITAIKGVSGSGKSSLIKEVLYHSWLKKRPINCAAVHGLAQFSEVLLIDQDAQKQNRLSTPLSYTGIIEQVQIIFSKTESAKTAGLKKGDFSYQSKRGKCPICAGYGQLKTSMDFMSDIWLTCDSCQGMRYHDAILACKFNNRSIGDVMRTTVQEAIDFFENGPIAASLKTLQRVGLGHVLLGQSGNTLSGGESQRLKLAKSMLRNRKGTTLYLFDEPGTGLHYFDILQLMTVFQSIIDRGDTLLFIEHNGTLIEGADRVVELGPGSGEQGGRVMEPLLS
jgi:excinuclease ABC subunit A